MWFLFSSKPFDSNLSSNVIRHYHLHSDYLLFSQLEGFLSINRTICHVKRIVASIGLEMAFKGIVGYSFRSLRMSSSQIALSNVSMDFTALVKLPLRISPIAPLSTNSLKVIFDGLLKI